MEGPIITTLLSLTFVGGLKMTNMSIPSVADTRDRMELYCRFDLENEDLFAVKWYKDDHEFFRYTPHQQPHKQTFHVPGVHLVTDDWDCSLSHCRLVMSGLTRPYSSGAYRCEISSEAPTFRLASETKNVTIATLPKDNPQIEGVREFYIEGDLITANCSSYPSDPAPILTWFINGVEASLFISNDVVSDPDENGLVSRSAVLTFQVEPKYFEKGDMINLRCVTALPGIPLPPLETVKQILIRSSKEHQQMVKNQKLHWFNNSVATVTSNCLTSSLFVLVWLVTFLR